MGSATESSQPTEAPAAAETGTKMSDGRRAITYKAQGEVVNSFQRRPQKSPRSRFVSCTLEYKSHARNASWSGGLLGEASFNPECTLICACSFRVLRLGATDDVFVSAGGAGVRGGGSRGPGGGRATGGAAGGARVVQSQSLLGGRKVRKP